MEINDKSVAPYLCDKYIEQPRAELVEYLPPSDKDILIHLFIEDVDMLLRNWIVVKRIKFLCFRSRFAVWI